MHAIKPLLIVFLATAACAASAQDKPVEFVPQWAKSVVWYQIFPDRFARSERVTKPSGLQPWGAPPTFHAYQGGDLLGVVEQLDYLADLGINAIYFNPIFRSGSNHRVLFAGWHSSGGLRSSGAGLKRSRLGTGPVHLCFL